MNIVVTMVTEVVVVMSPIEEYIRSNDEKINDIKKEGLSPIGYSPQWMARSSLDLTINVFIVIVASNIVDKTYITVAILIIN